MRKAIKYGKLAVFGVLYATTMLVGAIGDVLSHVCDVAGDWAGEQFDKAKAE